jgi:hypothetical protein
MYLFSTVSSTDITLNKFLNLFIFFLIFNILFIFSMFECITLHRKVFETKRPYKLTSEHVLLYTLYSFLF